MPEFSLNIVLFQPEIPQNTGSIGRLCVNLGATLHLIKPLGFSITEKQVKRAGLDYWKHLDLRMHDNWQAFLETESPDSLMFASTKGEHNYFDWEFMNGAYVVFGQESAGLPPDFYQIYKDSLYSIPMPGADFRSLNIANSVAVVAYECFRQYQVNSSS